MDSGTSSVDQAPITRSEPMCSVSITVATARQLGRPTAAKSGIPLQATNDNASALRRP